MARLRGLLRRGNTYYSRIVVPAHLAHLFGRREIWKSLRTSIRRDAEALHLQEASTWAAAFAEADKQLSQPNLINPSTKSNLTRTDAILYARTFFDRARANLDIQDRGPADLDQQAKLSAIEELDWEEATLQSWSNPDAHRLVGSAIESLSDLDNVTTDSSDSVFAELVRRALVQLVAMQRARLNGDYRDQITDSLFVGTRPSLRSQPMLRQSEVTVGECITRFTSEHLDIRPVTAKTRQKYQSALKQIGEHFGRQTFVSLITRADCNKFRDLLAKVGPNFGKGKPASWTLEKAANSNRTSNRLSWETQSNYLKMLSDLMAWAVRERLIFDNVAEKIVPRAVREPAETQRLPFSTTELKAIFNAPIYTGCVDDKRGFAKPGESIIRGSRYWLPLLALYTGMRMGEILQLSPSHIRTSEKGTPFIVLTRDMLLKTDNAEREIPIHPELVRLGFIEWVGARRDQDGQALFGDVPASEHGYQSDIFSKRFATFMKSINIANDRRPKLCFHSFRHTFKDALNETGATEEVKDELCGWSRGKKTGRRYGTGLSADLLKPVIDSVTFNLNGLPQRAE